MIPLLLFAISMLFGHIDGCGEEQKYAFFAALNADLVNPNSGDKVKFDIVNTNIGSAYSKDTGIYTAKAAGTYYFQVIANGPFHADDHLLHMALKKNGVTYGYLYIDHDREYWRHSSTSAVIDLNVGDRVYVEVFAVKGHRVLGGTTSAIRPGSHSQFLGYRL